MRILVVDDEPTRLETICRGLFIFSHEVSTARSFADAKALIAARGASAFDLLLTDITAPDGLGMALVDAAREIAPTLPVLVISGLTHGPELAALRALRTRMMAKPFTPDELDAAVRTAGREAEGLPSSASPPRRTGR